MDSVKEIIHIDMDAFFAQIEQRDNPEHKNKPVVVGGPLNRGVISAASYEARKYGLHSGMPLSRAKKLCPTGIYIPVDMEKYLKESAKIRKIFLQFTPLVEYIGCDEAFLDVSGCHKLFGDEIEIARKIKGKIYEQTNLTSSAGIGPNKFLAKLASSIGKPNGFTVLDSTRDIMEKVRLLPVSYLWGVGKVTKEEFQSMGIDTIGDLANAPFEIIESKFGEAGKVLHKMARGIDDRKVVPNQEPRSIGRETTFDNDTDNPCMLKSTLLNLSKKISRNLRLRKYMGKSITLKVRLSNFKTTTMRTTLKKYTCSALDIYHYSVAMLEKLDTGNKKIRLIGIYIGNLEPDSMSANLLPADYFKGESLARAVDKITDRFGDSKLTISRLEYKE